MRKLKPGDIVSYKKLLGRPRPKFNFKVIFPYKGKNKQQQPFGWNSENGYWIILSHRDKKGEFIVEGYCFIPPRDDNKIQLDYYTVDSPFTPYKTLFGYLTFEKTVPSKVFKKSTVDILKFELDKHVNLDCTCL